MKGHLTGESECPVVTARGGGEQLVAGLAFTLVHLAIWVGRLHRVCEDVQAGGKYEVFNFTIETARFRVFLFFFLIFLLHCAANGIFTGATGTSEPFFFLTNSKV